ncbi:MAG: hypothetical protein H6810_10785 [Phycisphaeraceae bacterium]|nr:MAG: hypothetical protein H6810_10785 [Phycisphaeraceae bacterium]
MADKPANGRPFYVGYLPLPRAHAVFLLVLLPLALAGLVVGALGLARTQPAWGDGFWQTGKATEFEGTLVLEPYPMLHVAREGGEITTYLLVEMGKFGTRDRFASAPELDGAAVSIRGRELHRDGRRMIEVDPDDPVLGPPVTTLASETPVVRAPLVEDGGAVTIRGEVVDSKCYLGAMKPGEGRGHKSCATLCISGGIPPVLVSRDADGVALYHLLTDKSGAGLVGSDLETIEPMIGETVVLSGRAGRIGSWRVLMLDDLSPKGGGVPSASP